MQAIDLARGEKKHRASKTGVKGRKKDEKRKKKLGLSAARHNPKAFSVANIVRTKRTQQRNLDRAQKKEVVPLVDRSEDLPPPFLVVVMGPPGCGKSTLIRSLVKIFTNQNMTDILGPITVIAGKKKRLTFFECPQDVHSMTDLAKVADLVLLMIDGSYGFEMETFEFLNLLQLHGFPKVLGVVTHLDRFKLNKTLQATKKKLKHRFWTEIYKGAKMFDFTGVISGKYLKHEVKRLTLHMSRMKFRPLLWRNTHPYVVVDRVEDATPAEQVQRDGLCDRDVVLFGYVRGTHLKQSTRLHLIGVGDFDMASVSALPDPCPLPFSAHAAGAPKGAQRTTLKASKDSLLYAPLANVGRVRMDKDGTYIELHSVHYTKPELLDISDRGQQGAIHSHDALTPAGLLRSMQDVATGVNEKMEDAELALFSGSNGVKSSEVQLRDIDVNDGYSDDSGEESAEEEMDDDEEDDEEEEEDGEDSWGDGSEEEGCGDEAEMGTGPGGFAANAWKLDMAEKAAVLFSNRSSAFGGGKIMSLIYGDNWASDGDAASAARPVASAAGRPKAAALWEEDQDEHATDPLSGRTANDIDSSRVQLSSGSIGIDFDELLSELTNSIRNKFVTGDWDKANMISTNAPDPSMDAAGSGDEAYGEFEDLQTGEVFGSARSAGGTRGRDHLEESEDSDAESEDNDEIDAKLRALNAEKKAKSYISKAQKEDEDGVRDLNDGGGADSEEKELERQIEAEQRRRTERQDRNRTEFGEEGELARLRHEGLRQGLYVRILIKGVPAEFVKGFRPYLPVILGGLQPHESALGVVHARVKRHRWHKRILKCNDPLIFSIGWRRFQSIPVYAMEDDSDRKRYLKYTPEHMHCMCSFYGPLVPPNTGILAYQKTDRSSAGFRIALTGTAVEMSASASIVKKLKLVGTPTKTFKNTAFIKGMFNTALEVAKFEGSKLRTVSGIRGQIKKAVKGDAESGGTFRATFEDKISMSDIVFCRGWVPVQIKEFYNPVTSLLLSGSSSADPPLWEGMRPIAQLRKDENVPIAVNKDSVYKPIVRTAKTFSKLIIPKKLQESLPFASKPKEDKAKNPASYMARRAVVVDPEDRKRRAAVQMLSTIRADKMEKRHKANVARGAKKDKQKKQEAAKFADVHHEAKKRKYAEEGKSQAFKLKKQKIGI